MLVLIRQSRRLSQRALFSANMPTMPSAEMQALRDYVTYDSGSLNQAESTVLLEVTHSNLKAKFMQIRLDKHVMT